MKSDEVIESGYLAAVLSQLCKNMHSNSLWKFTLPVILAMLDRLLHNIT